MPRIIPWRLDVTKAHGFECLPLFYTNPMNYKIEELDTAGDVIKTIDVTANTLEQAISDYFKARTPKTGNTLQQPDNYAVTQYKVLLEGIRQEHSDAFEDIKNQPALATEVNALVNLRITSRPAYHVGKNA